MQNGIKKKPLFDGSSSQPCHLPQASSENEKEHSLMADSQISKKASQMPPLWSATY